MAQGMFLSQKMMLSQVLAPQLQQSLALLQAPTLELKAMVEQELQQNPILEEVPSIEAQADAQESREDDGFSNAMDPCAPPADVTVDPTVERKNEVIDDFQAEFERLVQLDSEWREHFNQGNIPLRQKEEEEEKRQFMFDALTTHSSLQEDLLDQVRLSEMNEEERRIAEMIVGNIDDRGYLQASVDELAFSTNIPAEKITRVLKVVHAFDPPGVGARDLKECLQLQLERAEKTNSLEYKIVSNFLDSLGRRRLPDIAKALETSVSEVQNAAERIAHLEPYPGRGYINEESQYVVPELFIQKQDDEYIVTSNNDHFPHLRISNAYKDIMSQADSSQELRDYIRDKIRAGKFLIKSLHQRQQTILNIAKEIVKRQREFLDNGTAFLKPMTMLQIAEAVGVHETTVSRAVSGKYMQTPQGVFEMKYFFTSGIQTASGVGMSNTSVKDLIADMVRKEDISHPLSDDQIVKILGQKGIQIARRTVAKYRSELNILPSTMRKVY